MQINILALFIVIQSLLACQQDPGVTRVAASVDFSTGTTFDKKVEQPASFTTDIIFRSTDGGQTWQDVSAGLPRGMQVWSLFANEGEVMLGTENGLYRSSSASYQAPSWEKDFMSPERISTITPGRFGPYFCSVESGVFQAIPGTDIWLSKYSDMKYKQVRTLLEMRNGVVFVGSDSGIFKSSDGGKNWKQVFEGGMILDIVETNGVLIGGGRAGVLRSTDGGEHWESVLNENILAKRTGVLQDRFFTILGTKDPSKVHPEGITSRLRVSGDGGKTWERMERALLPVEGMYDMDERLSTAKDIYDIVQVGEYLICTFDTGIFRSSDQGRTWELVLPSTDKRVLANLSVSGNVIYVTAGGGC